MHCKQFISLSVASLMLAAVLTVANADVGEPETQALLFSFARLRGFLSC